MECLSWLWNESEALMSLAVPSVLSNVLEGSMAVVDVLMLGRLGKGHLAALSVGNAFFNIPWFFIEGFLTAQDTLGANAHGAGDAASVRQWSYIALGLVLALCLVASVTFLFAEPILGQLFWVSYHLKTKAAVHIYLMLPGMWFLSLSRVLQKVRHFPSFSLSPSPSLALSLSLSPSLPPLFHALTPVPDPAPPSSTSKCRARCSPPFKQA